MPGARSLLTQVRQDPATKLFVSIAANVPVDVQDGGEGVPPVQGESYLVPDAVYTPHTLYIKRVLGQTLPDVRIGDSLVNPSDLDPLTYGPATYLVSFVRRWSNHLEAAARKPVQPANLQAYNAQTIATWQQSATWLQRITEQTAGAVRGSGFDAVRQQETVRSDGTYGVGWQAPDPTTGATRYGYIPRGTVSVGIVDAATLEEMTPDGLEYYEGPICYTTPPTLLGKDDVLVLPAPDSRRFVVKDTITPLQTYGQAVLYRATLDLRAANDLVYSVPTT